ncbi:MAG: hypothetical protein M1156_00470, partial [Candidatus Marsarchaeota archaeon]|nr:hypothetical protein [Candidatus Marsarchaeota archaeon]
LDLLHVFLLDGKMHRACSYRYLLPYKDVFAKAAYEETVKHLVNAAAFSEIDNMRGVTENILVGKQIPIGTGSVHLAIKKEDMQKVKPESKHKK